MEGSNKSASDETDKDVYIDFWGVWANDNYRAMYWQEKAAEFCEAYEAETGISVAFEYSGQCSYGAVSEKLAGGAVTKELPVISQVEEQATARFYPLAADLSKYLSAEALDDYLDGLMVSCTQQGTVCAVPAGSPDLKRDCLAATSGSWILRTRSPGTMSKSAESRPCWGICASSSP